MKKFILFITIIVAGTACKEKVQSQEVTDRTISEEHKAPRELVQEDLTAVVIQQLQGTWERTDYPHNTRIFKGSEVKLISEGDAEPAGFTSFQISSDCDTKSPIFNLNNFYFKVDKYKSCTLIRMGDGYESFSLVEDEDNIISFQKVQD